MDLTKIAGILGGWALVNAVLYLHIYYAAFNINPFQFVSLSDALGPAIKTIVPGVLTVVFAALTGDRNILSRYSISESHFFPLAGCALIFLMFAGGSLLLHLPIWLFVILASVISLLITLIAVGATNWKVLVQHVPNPHARALICGGLLSMPAFVIFVGIAGAKDLIDGRRYSYVEGAQLPSTIKASNSARYRFVGKLGPTWFLMPEDDQSKIILVDGSNLSTLSLAHVKKSVF